MNEETGFLSTAGKVLADVYKAVKEGRLLDMAAALAFYGVLSIFPFLIASVSLASWFVDPEWVMQRTGSILSRYFPNSNGLIVELVRETMAARPEAGILSSLLLFWTGGKVFGTLTSSLNSIFLVEDLYGFFKILALRIIMTLSIGVLFFTGLVSSVLIAFLKNALDIIPFSSDTFALLSVVLPAGTLFLALFLTYRWIPRKRPSSSSALIGALGSLVLLITAQPLFTFYIGRFAQFNLIYGSLSILISLMMWIWAAWVIILLGAVVAFQVQQRQQSGKVTR